MIVGIVFSAHVSLLGGIVVRVFAILLKVRGFRYSRDDVFLRAMKIRSTAFFG
jgi:hypothetical protein